MNMLYFRMIYVHKFLKNLLKRQKDWNEQVSDLIKAHVRSNMFRSVGWYHERKLSQKKAFDFRFEEK